MFLSSTDQSSPNNPSSSSNFLHLTNSSDELGQSSFSIRDYAFSYRTKNIKKSWPFSSTSLQLCLKHGLSDLLPPIQPPGSVISHPPEALSLKKPNITHVEAINHKRKLEKLGSNQISAKTKEGFENGLLATTSNSKIQVATVNKNPRKKCGLIVKPGACVDSRSKEDHRGLFAASESMALGTCPICKTFSSASNTTLNAHIDQCLSVDSVEQPMSKPNKPRTKPRLKVKSMVDIYATAKECTLEDLDRRNGTKWAMVSSYSNRVVSDSKPEASNKEKKKQRVLRVCADEDDAGIGPVYIDAKGQKLRILSEPSQEHEEDVSEKKFSSEGKRFRKRLRGKKHSKQFTKPVPQSRKLIVRKGNASKVPEDQRGYFEEGSGMERSETPGPSQRRLSRNGNEKGTKFCDQPCENGHSLSGDSLVLRGPSHVSTTDLSETVSSPLKSQNSWRIGGESQVSGKSWALSKRKSAKSASSFVANPLSCSVPVDKVFASEAKGFMKLKKARLDFSENEDEDEDEEDTGKWESEMTQERELTDFDDWDDNEETDKVLLSSNPSISGEDNGYESYEETGNNEGDDDMLDKTNDADAEFESMIYEKSGCETAEGGSSFMEVDPIPIPGPPGSFLPSPWDMGTDAFENHGNSSVITSQVQSPQDQLDLTDRNTSESPVSAMSNFAAPETQTLNFHNMVAIDKRPSRFRDNDQSCCCQRKDKAFEDATFGGQPPHMIQQDLDLLSKSVPTIPSNSNPVLRLMGKDLLVINQREEASLGDLSLKPTSQSLDLSKTQQLSPPVHLHHRPFGGNGLYFDTNTSFYNIP
uniref:Hapless 8 n=1 Tax=Noccaea caerulescens TaxID=107243 RepID=A0A1J3ECX1_NOCCA